MHSVYEWWDRLIGFAKYGPPETGTIVLFWLAVFMALLILGAIVWGIYSGLDSRLGKWYEYTGTVADKGYAVPQTSTSTSLVSNGQGGLTTQSHTTYEPEHYILWVWEVNGQSQKLFCGQTQWLTANHGDKVVFWRKIGGLSRTIIDTSCQRPKLVTIPIGQILP